MTLELWELNHFNLDAKGEISFGPFIRVGGSLGASRKGVGACASLEGPFGTSWHPGIGITWNFDVDLLPHSCGVGRWEEPRTSSLAVLRSGVARTVVVEPGAGVAIRATGASASPVLVLTGPNGTSFTTSPNALVRGPRWLAFSDDRARQTAVLLRAQRRETWVVTPASGSPEPLRIESAGLLPQPSVHATVTGRGHARVLHYRVVPLPGQRLTFLEHTRNVSAVLGVARGAAGAIRFAPADGVAGPRTILAVVEQDGLERARLTAAHYSAPGLLMPGRPGRIMLHRVRGGVRVRFGRAVDATSYAVGVRTGDGRLFTSTTTHLAVVVRGPAASDRLRVRVVGLRGHGRRGPAATARLAPTPGALGPSSAPAARAPRSRPSRLRAAIPGPLRTPTHGTRHARPTSRRPASPCRPGSPLPARSRRAPLSRAHRRPPTRPWKHAPRRHIIRRRRNHRDPPSPHPHRLTPARSRIVIG